MVNLIFSNITNEIWFATLTAKNAGGVARKNNIYIKLVELKIESNILNA